VFWILALRTAEEQTAISMPASSWPDAKIKDGPSSALGIPTLLIRIAGRRDSVWRLVDLNLRVSAKQRLLAAPARSPKKIGRAKKPPITTRTTRAKQLVASSRAGTRR
jgi:hypothetical protein